MLEKDVVQRWVTLPTMAPRVVRAGVVPGKRTMQSTWGPPAYHEPWPSRHGGWLLGEGTSQL